MTQPLLAPRGTMSRARPALERVACAGREGLLYRRRRCRAIMGHTRSRPARSGTPVRRRRRRRGIILAMSEQGSLTKAQRIFIRVGRRVGRGSPELKEGDRALGALLILHGRIMNGGVYHGVIEASSDKVEAGLGGYDYFGLDELSAVLKRFRDNPGDSDADANSAYYCSKPDRMIQEHFERRLAQCPGQFAPL